MMVVIDCKMLVKALTNFQRVKSVTDFLKLWIQKNKRKRMKAIINFD